MSGIGPGEEPIFLISHYNTKSPSLHSSLHPSIHKRPSTSKMGLAKVSILTITIALLSILYSHFNSRLDEFYIFDPSHLHDLSQRAIQTHGNDTAGVVDFIVSELDARPTSTGFINRKQEWFFNNAGGAMGAMYVVHASITEYLIIFGRADLPFTIMGLFIMVDRFYTQAPQSVQKATRAATQPTTTSISCTERNSPSSPGNTDRKYIPRVAFTIFPAARSSSTRWRRRVLPLSMRVAGFRPCCSLVMPMHCPVPWICRRFGPLRGLRGGR